MTNHEHVTHTQGHDPAGGGPERFVRRGRWVFWIFGIIAAIFLLSEHRVHVLGALPFLILLACPLLHMFMHGGHGGHGESSGRQPPRDTPRDSKE